MDYNYIFRRQHPLYRQRHECWLRSQSAYAGGADYIRQALIQHVSEVDLEFLERLNRAYYFNYPRKIARLITQYVLASEPARPGARVDILEDFSCSNLRVNEVMRQFSTLLNVYGSAWMLVEMPCNDGVRSASDPIRPYAMALSPLSVVDWSVDRNGQLAWALIEERNFENSSPYQAAQTTLRRRLWTPEKWQLFESFSGEVKLVAEKMHHLGRVPLIHVEESDGFGMNAGHWFEDAVRISDAILNNESEAQMNIIKQMFGVLVISENFAHGVQSLSRREDSREDKFSHKLARSAAIWESSSEAGISRYIAPNGAETATIRSENANLKAELFDVVGLTLIRETRELQSAASKAWDHQLVRQFLVNRVDLLEQSEKSAWQLMNAYDPAVPVPEISYNRDFAIIDLKESIAGLLELRSIDAGSEYQREIARAAVSMLNYYQKIDPARQQEIFEEIARREPAVAGGAK